MIFSIEGRQCGKGSIVEFQIERHYVHVEDHFFFDDFNVYLFVVDYFAHLIGRFTVITIQLVVVVVVFSTISK